MAAHNGNDSTGKKNYYNISYGMLSTKLKEIPEGYSEVKAAELKSKTEKVEAIDVRKKYIDKGGDYPYACFFSGIVGVIQAFEKDDYDKGVNLKVTILDADGDESILQTKFFGKTSADFLNRLLSVSDNDSELAFTPYMIPSDSEIDGSKVKFYNQGVSIKEDGKKLERAFKKDNGLPDTERITNAEGKDTTSRVKQVNFLWEKVLAKFRNLTEKDSTPKQEASAPKKEDAKKETASTPVPQSHDDLPF